MTNIINLRKFYVIAVLDTAIYKIENFCHYRITPDNDKSF